MLSDGSNDVLVQGYLVLNNARDVVDTPNSRGWDNDDRHKPEPGREGAPPNRDDSWVVDRQGRLF